MHLYADVLEVPGTTSGYFVNLYSSSVGFRKIRFEINSVLHFQRLEVFYYFLYLL